MVQNGSRCESLNYETLATKAAIIVDLDLHHARLDHDQAVNRLVLLEDDRASIVCPALHAVEKLLLRNHVQGLEVGDLVHLHLQKGSQRVIVLEYVVLKLHLDRCELFRELFETRLRQTGQ